MKRKTLLFSLILAMVIISLALCGADAPDGNISMDEDDFVELVVDAPLSLHYLESVYSLKAVNQMVGNEGEDGFAEVLFNANDEAEYVLATAEEGGYAIFHRMTGALMEAGEFGASPYAGQSGKKYYFGPSNYAVKDVNDVTTDIMRGGVMTTEQITAMHQYMAQKRTEVVESAGIKNYAEMQKALVSFQTYEAQQNGEAVVASVEGGTWNTNPYEDEVNVGSFTEIEHSEFYKNMVSVRDFGYNSHGSCKFVTTVLLLRYYDAFYHPSLIPDQDIPAAWENVCNNANDVADPTDLNRDKFKCDIDENDSVYEGLHKFLIATSDSVVFSTYGFDTTDYNATLPSCIQVDNTKLVRIPNTAFNSAKEFINDNTPVAMLINYTDDNGAGSHAVVAYGYLENSNGKYYKAHFGWPEQVYSYTNSQGQTEYDTYSFSSIILPHRFFSVELNYLTITDLHTDSSQHNCSQYGMVGGQAVSCFANEGHKYYPSDDGLGHLCGCGITETHEGLGIIESWEDYLAYNADNYRTLFLQGKMDEFYHSTACEKCLQHYDPTHDFSIKTQGWSTQYTYLDILFDELGWDIIKAPHSFGQTVAGEGKCVKICSCCGKEIETLHAGNFTYIGRINYHITTCTNCGGTFQENHAYAIGINGCVFCGYGADLGGGIIHNA